MRYHEGGRFCEKDEEWDQLSAMFHLETAAMCGELEAIVAIGQCYLQLPHHVLSEVEVEVCPAIYLLAKFDCFLNFFITMLMFFTG